MQVGQSLADTDWDMGGAALGVMAGIGCGRHPFILGILSGVLSVQTGKTGRDG